MVKQLIDSAVGGTRKEEQVKILFGNMEDMKRGKEKCVFDVVLI